MDFSIWFLTTCVICYSLFFCVSPMPQRGNQWADVFHLRNRFLDLLDHDFWILSVGHDVENRILNGFFLLLGIQFFIKFLIIFIIALISVVIFPSIFCIIWIYFLLLNPCLHTPVFAHFNCWAIIPELDVLISLQKAIVIYFLSSFSIDRFVLTSLRGHCKVFILNFVLMWTNILVVLMTKNRHEYSEAVTSFNLNIQPGYRRRHPCKCLPMFFPVTSFNLGLKFATHFHNVSFWKAFMFLKVVHFLRFVNFIIFFVWL